MPRKEGNQIRKLVVGVDYGTTYSGISYITSNFSGADDIDHVGVIDRWPTTGGGNNETRDKVPSRIAYQSENQRHRDFTQDRDIWGHEVAPGLKSYSWTKLLLDEKASKSTFDDSFLKNKEANTRDGVLRLPKGKDAEQVVADYLTHLYQHCISVLEKKLTPAVLSMTPIDFWFTHPAIWSDLAKNATTNAAKKAGFGTRMKQDTINLVSEPEAAAITTLRVNKNRAYQPKDKTGVLVCDCGGGTVDVTTYTITSTNPQVQVDEACPGKGGKCGSTSIDRRMHDLLSKRFGAAFTSLPPEKTGVGSKFMKDFESEKLKFDGKMSWVPLPLKLKMPLLQPGAVSDDHYDFDDDEILLSAEDFKQCFDPVIKLVLKIVKNQVEETTKRGAPAIETIVLVGGFGESDYLWECLRKWCTDNGNIQAIAPDHAWSAIVRGAALRGLHKGFVRKKLCKNHYGIAISRPLELITGEYEKDDVWTNIFRTSKRFKDGEPWVRGYMEWRFKKNDEVRVGDKSSFRSFPITKHYCTKDPPHQTLKIYSCSKDKAPERLKDGNTVLLGTVSLDLGDIDLRECQSERSGGFLGTVGSEKWYKIVLSCLMTPEDETGKLSVKVEWTSKAGDIRPCGSAKFIFAVG